MSKKRWSIWKELLFNHWRWTVNAAFGLLVILQAFRGELSPQSQPKFFVSQYLPNWSPWVWVSVALAVSLLMVLESAYKKISKLEDDVLPIAFYENRESLKNAKGGLQKELDNLREGLAMWPGGATALAYPMKTFSHINRLILLDPDNAVGVAHYCKRFDATEQNMVSVIRDVTRRAQEAGVDVRWSQHVSLGLIINDPNGTAASARAEFFLPGVESSFRPNIWFTKDGKPELFDQVIKAYEYEWNSSKEAAIVATR